MCRQHLQFIERPLLKLDIKRCQRRQSFEAYV
jgi:hypothetical protein